MCVCVFVCILLMLFILCELVQLYSTVCHRNRVLAHLLNICVLNVDAEAQKTFGCCMKTILVCSV